MTLTDADREKIEAIPAVSVTEANARTCYSAGYEAGLRAGMERAAKVCDQISDGPWEDRELVALRCAEKIRALAEPKAG